jgi:hypothetical protein
MITKREHDAMLRVKQDAGWRYGETYDEAAKTDPGMVAYEQLTFEDGEPVEVLPEPVEDDMVAMNDLADQAQAEVDEAALAPEDSTDGE